MANINIKKYLVIISIITIILLVMLTSIVSCSEWLGKYTNNPIEINKENTNDTSKSEDISTDTDTSNTTQYSSTEKIFYNKVLPILIIFASTIILVIIIHFIIITYC